MKIRRAIVSDAEEIKNLINIFSKKNLMLSVTTDYVLEHLNHYFVAVDKKRIIGTVFLRPYGPSLAEIRSLAVLPSFHKSGIGTKLIKFVIRESKKIGIKKLFCLTLVPDFFKKLGFKEEERTTFPQKIWLDCSSCVKKDCCDEIALSIEIKKNRE